jgi:hypothetical protein
MGARLERRELASIGIDQFVGQDVVRLEADSVDS